MDEPGNCLYDLDMEVPFLILQAGRTRCRAATWKASAIWSDVAKFYAPVDGAGWVSFRNRRTPLRPGRAYLIPPHARLSYAATPELTVDWLHFSPSSPLLDAQLSALRNVLVLPPECAAHWRSTSTRLAAILDRPTAGLTCRVQALLLDAVGRALEQEPPAVQSAGVSRLLPALQYMDDHVMAPPSLTALARQISCSPEHFHRLFTATYHVTPFLYLQRRRLTRASQLLTEGVMSVKEVAAACGYPDPYYFSRVFRRHFGYPPRDVRIRSTHHRC